MRRVTIRAATGRLRRVAPLAALGLAVCLQLCTWADDGLERRIAALARVEATSAVVSPDRFEIDELRVSLPRLKAGSSPTPRLESITGPNAGGMIRARFSLVRGDAVIGQATAVVRGRVFGPALVAERPLRPGEPIGSEALRSGDSDLTRLTAAPLRDPDDALGLTVSRTIGAGRVLTRRDVVATPAVRRGDAVEVEARRGRMVVRIVATALRDAAVGENLPLLNETSGKRIDGVVTAPGAATVRRGTLR